MRVAVVGATGNVGTAVLRALAAEPTVTGVVGVVRRPPEPEHAPYAGVAWHAVDLALHDGETVAAQLAAAFRGVDAVIHLAWAIQPSGRRDYLRRVNVDGTRRVAEAAAAAGVEHLVVASSVGAYSPVADDVPRAEGAARTGTPSSHYSVDKAAQERVLDDVERCHPGLRVARTRAALVFQADAGAAVGRYFLGPHVPRTLLRERSLPVLPLPAGLRLQVVHADDLAQAYLRILLTGASGAFNVAAADVLRPDDLARLLDHGHRLTLPARLVRPVLHAAWRTGLVPVDAGWLDMALGVPLMDSGRIRALGWSERCSAEDTLLEMTDGLREGRGTASAALRPGDTAFGGPVETGRPPAGARGREAGADSGWTVHPLTARTR